MANDMSASSSSALGRKVNPYNPNCLCGAKARLCTTRDSGRQFYGCQRWKDGLGCGYFLWKDDVVAFHENNEAYLGVNGSMESTIHELERLMSVMQLDIETIKQVLESEAKEKMFWKRMWQGLLIFILAVVIVKKL
ncbi:unnamed protein product [Cuscuta epithymum]|uniref:GRF-type domain-containing protein n=1 Tax=Cuscuta epithymum TaxID=186058 RepID=A0AAV0G8L3_9ASTE|nr:unnamed protein product [Cuscuta epithymum]